MYCFFLSMPSSNRLFAVSLHKRGVCRSLTLKSVIRLIFKWLVRGTQMCYFTSALWMSVQISSEIWVSAVSFYLSKPQFTFTIQILKAGWEDNSFFSCPKAFCTQPPLAWSFAAWGTWANREHPGHAVVQPRASSHTIPLIHLPSSFLGPDRHYSHWLQGYSVSKLEVWQHLTTYS